MNGHVFQSANEHKGIEVRAHPHDMVANQHLGICVNPVSRQLKP